MDDDGTHEDYWNTSETSAKAITFDDDVLSPDEMLAIGMSDRGVRAGEYDSDNVLSGPAVKPALLSINTLISSQAMQMLLQAQSGGEPTASVQDRGGSRYMRDESVSASIHSLVTGRARSLHRHRTLQHKTQLLDAALAIGDGDTIITVIMFLMASLQRSLAVQLLSSRPLALSHYISHLHAEANLTQLTDLLTMLGKCAEATMYQFEHLVKVCLDPHTLLTRLQHLQTDHLSTLQAQMVTDYIKLLEWQLCAKVDSLMNASTLQCVHYCCSHHYTETAGRMMSPLTLCQQQKLSRQQYDWVAISVHAAHGNWSAIEELITKRTWLGKTSVCSEVPLARIVRRLHRARADKNVLAAFINMISNAEQRLQVAQQYKVDSVVVESLVRNRDRAALTAHKMSLEPHSEPYLLAEIALQNPAVKWKN